MMGDMHTATDAPAPDRPTTTGIVVLCDVRGSRSLPDRPAFLDRLESALEDVNEASDALLGTFELQAGLDEFAGVVRPGRAAPILLRLWEDLHPVEVRFAVVHGLLDVIPETPANDDCPGAAGFDGPAFHRADDLLDGLRRGERLVEIRAGGSGREDRLLTALGDLLYGQILAWTERQVEVVRTYRRLGTQQAAAAELGVSQSTVSRALSAVDYRRTRAAGQVFVESLDAIVEEGGT